MSGRILICLLLAVVVATPFFPATVLAAEHESGGDGQAWQRDLALWTIVVFVCLVFILAKFAWKPLAGGLDRREQGIADQIAQANAANEKAKELLAEHERKLDEAKMEVHGILDQGRRDAEELGQELLKKAREEAAAEHVRAIQQIEAASDAAIKNLADQSADGGRVGRQDCRRKAQSEGSRPAD